MKKITPVLFTIFILFFTNCEKEEVSTTEDNKMTSEIIDKNQLKSELKNIDILTYISTNKYIQNNNYLLSRINNEAELFEKIVKPNDFITYSLKLNNYSNTTPYFKYFIINQDEDGEKVGFVKYIPSSPTYILDVDHFTGDIEIYDVDNDLFAKTSFQNGQVVNNKNEASNRSCYNVSYLVGMPCSHGGNHMPGQSCEEGYINDAYFIVRTTVVCVNPPKTLTPPDEFGGTGGGGTGTNILLALNIPPPYEGEPNLDNLSFLSYYEIVTFLQNNTAYTNIINHNYANANLLNEWLIPSITYYFRVNGGFTQENQIKVISALNNFIQFLPLYGNQYNLEENIFNKNNVLQLLINNANWLSNQTNEVKQDIFNYLIQKDLSPEAVDFTNELINRSKETGLNFDIELSTKSPAFIDFTAIDTSRPDDKKLDYIHNKLTNSPEFKRLFEGTFGGTQEKLNIKFETQANLVSEQGNPVDAKCVAVDAPAGSNGYYQKIIVNKNILAGNNTASNIIIAKAIIHEYIHAYLNAKYININQGASLTFLSNQDLEQMMHYAFTPFNPLGLGNSHHNFMFNQMIPIFQTILSEIVNDLLSPQNINDLNSTTITQANGTFIENFNFMNFYKYLAFEGLHTSQSYINDIANNPIELRKYEEYIRFAVNSSSSY